MFPSNDLLYLAERSTELFFIYDLIDERFTYMNPTCVAFFHLKDHQIESQVLLNLINPEDQKHIISKFKSCINGKVVSDVECRVRQGQNEKWLRITPYLSTLNNSRSLIGQALDVTAVKANSEVLHNHNNKKNSILNILAHDLAGSIGVMQNLSAMLGRETAALKNQRIDRYVSMISRICKSDIHLIHDFLDQEFLESAGVRLLKKRIELVSKLQTVIQEYLDMQDELTIQFSSQANKEIIYVEIDEDKFMQVINNLISNALKFTSDGGLITLNVEERQDDVLISVSDTGIGIPQKYHATLFDKFTDARRRGLKGEQSTGLGMSIIKTIVEWHQGKIWFESEENKGTNFYIQLPKVF